MTNVSIEQLMAWFSTVLIGPFSVCLAFLLVGRSRVVAVCCHHPSHEIMAAQIQLVVNRLNPTPWALLDRQSSAACLGPPSDWMAVNYPSLDRRLASVMSSFVPLFRRLFRQRCRHHRLLSWRSGVKANLVTITRTSTDRCRGNSRRCATRSHVNVMTMNGLACIRRVRRGKSWT